MSLYRIAPLKIITRAQFNNIESIAIHYDWNLAFSGRSHGNEHLARTVKLISHLWDLIEGKKEPDILDCAVAGGLLHDIGLVFGNPGHCFNGRKIADELLKQTNISDEIVEHMTERSLQKLLKQNLCMMLIQLISLDPSEL
jgi:hypothetical protein